LSRVLTGLFQAQGKKSKSHFDHVITNQTIPNLTAMELIDAVKKIRRDISPILCTGSRSKINEYKAKELGISVFITKPVGFSSLLQTMRPVLDEKKFLEYNHSQNIKTGIPF